jgi:hypothetical protein
MKLAAVNAVPRFAMGNDNITNPQDMARSLWEKASDLLKKHGELQPVVFIFTNEVCFILSATHFMINQNAKEALRELLLEAVKVEKSIVGIAFVMEIWKRTGDKEELEKLKEEYKSIREYPDKEEGILVQCEWCDNRQYMLQAAFKKVNDQIVLEEPETADCYSGRFADLFPPSKGTTVH